LAELIEPLTLETPPDPVNARVADLWQGVKLARRLYGARGDAMRLSEIFLEPATRMLDRWFESEPLRATLATDAIIGAFAPPSHPGTAYVLFHHVMGETGGKRGVWGYVRGGMGALTEALASAARDLSVDIACEAPVTAIRVADGRVQGVVLADGREVRASVVASCIDAAQTFTRLIDPATLPDDFRAAIDHIDYGSAAAKINLTLAEPPDFRALPGREPGPQHRGTIHIAPTIDEIERAYDDAKWGKPSRRPILECTIPSVVDDSLTPPGRHLMSMFVQYAPYELAESTWDQQRDAFADTCIDLLTEYAPNFRNAVIDRQVLTPVDLERTFGLTGGNIFQGAMSPAQLFSRRPVPGWCQYRTPIDGLYLCGSAAHPGGGVIGAAGYNAARTMLKRS
jgi:phytoene dehydrogenase-like protein